jgi:aspartate-semialdehyde dehydrogenase
MVVSSYQAVSGSGQRGITELTHQNEILGKDLEALVDGGWSDPGADLYVRPIGWNVVPFAGSESSDGYTDEELKLVNETHKILEAPDVGVEATCVRVPVMTGHAAAATLWFERPLGVDEAAELLGQAPGVQLWEDMVPTPLDSVGIDDVLVGRLRTTLGTPGGISLWTVGDNLRKGAALNAVQLAELLL